MWKVRYLPKAALLVAFVAGNAQSPAQVWVRFDPPDQTVHTGDPVVIGLVADFSAPIVGWGLDLSIDAASLLTETSPPVIGPSWVPASAADGDGLAGLAFPNAVTGSNVRLATLSFTAKSEGIVRLTASYTPGDLSEGFALDPTGFASVNFDSATITIIPEPSALACACCGLGCLGLAHRRNRRRALLKSKHGREKPDGKVN